MNSFEKILVRPYKVNQKEIEADPNFISYKWNATEKQKIFKMLDSTGSKNKKKHYHSERLSV